MEGLNLDLKKPWLIIGKGSFAQTTFLSIKDENNSIGNFLGLYEFTLINNEINLPNELINFERIQVLVCIGYSNMNNHREHMIKVVKNNLKLINVNWISKKAYIASDLRIGYSNIILPMAIIEPSVELVNGIVFWFGSHVAHNSKIFSNCWIAARTSIGANCVIGKNCFFGISSTIPSGSILEDYVLLTSGAICNTKVKKFKVIENNVLAIKGNSSQEDDNKMIKSLDYIRFL